MVVSLPLPSSANLRLTLVLDYTHHLFVTDIVKTVPLTFIPPIRSRNYFSRHRQYILITIIENFR